MSTAKFEKLIDLIINENQEQAEQLFHEIVVEKSREIYESLMQEDDLVDDLMSEVESDEVDSMDVSEAEDEMDDMGDEDMGDMDDMDDMGDEDMGDMEDMDEMGDEDMGDMEDMDDMGDEDMGDMDDMGDEESSEPASKDDILDLEDKIDELMAKFEAMMSDDESEESDDSEESDEEETEVMEAVEMKKVAQPKGEDHKAVSPVAKKGAMGMAGKPVNFTGSSESVPTAPKAPANYATKGESQVKGAGSFKNSPGAKVSEKGESAPKPKAETVSAKSPVAESRKTAKKIVK